MGTTDRRANITNKKLLGTEDLRDRILGYLQNLNVESVQARFDVDGVFNTAMTLSGGTDTVTLNGTQRTTDGLGHVLTPSRLSDQPAGLFTAPTTTVQFENALGIVYGVGARYAEIPIQVAINPRTGAPEYLGYEETIGESGTPTSVTDNGNGTITFDLSSVTETGVDYSGLRCIVFLNTPAAGGVNIATAVEELVVSFANPTNSITTSGTLGQTTVSTAAADYTVVVMGLTTRRNFDLEASSNHVFFGTVTGAGAGNTPTTFDTSNQRLLRTFQDATQIVVTPYQWITATNVQSALQQIVDNLGDTGTVTPGATRVGVNPSNWAPITGDGVPATVAWGGIGNITDGTFPDVASRSLQNVLDQVDLAVRRRQSWTRTITENRNNIEADTQLTDFENVAMTGAGYGDFWIRDGSNPYIINTTTTENRLFCENPNQDLESPGSNATNAFRQLRGGVMSSGGGELLFTSTVVLEDLEVERDVLDFSFASAPYPSYHLKNCRVEGGTSGTPALTVGGGNTESAYFIAENCYFEGRLDLNGGDDALIIFRNCEFRQEGAQSIINDPNARGRIIFENCHFLGASTSNDQRILNVGTFTSTTEIVFKNCEFEDFWKSGIDFEEVTLINCIYVSGSLWSGNVAASFCMTLTSCYVYGLNIIMGDWDAVTATGRTELISFTNSAGRRRAIHDVSISAVGTSVFPTRPFYANGVTIDGLDLILGFGRGSLDTTWCEIFGCQGTNWSINSPSYFPATTTACPGFRIASCEATNVNCSISDNGVTSEPTTTAPFFFNGNKLVNLQLLGSGLDLGSDSDHYFLLQSENDLVNVEVFVDGLGVPDSASTTRSALGIEGDRNRITNLRMSQTNTAGTEWSAHPLIYVAENNFFNAINGAFIENDETRTGSVPVITIEGERGLYQGIHGQWSTNSTAPFILEDTTGADNMFEGISAERLSGGSGALLSTLGTNTSVFDTKLI